MYCQNCRAELEEDSKFCPICGAAVNKEKQERIREESNIRDAWETDTVKRAVRYESQPLFTGMQIRNYNPALDYNPIGMWGYFLYTILLNIPILGWIFIIAFSVGATKNINLRNFARSWLCTYIIAAVLLVMRIWPYLELAMR